MSEERNRGDTSYAIFSAGTVVAAVIVVLVLWLRTRKWGADEWFMGASYVNISRYHDTLLLPNWQLIII